MEELLRELEILNREKDAIAIREKNIKKELESQLNEDGYKCDFLTISYSKASTSTTIDISALQKNEPELYEDLLKDYPKTTTRKAGFSYRFKK